MSGFEIAGAVLGGLPLLISTIEHYDDIVRPFKRWRKFVPELELFRIELDLERISFRNDCFLLLETLTDRQTAQRALNSSLRIDASLNERYTSRLGDSVDACDETIRVILEKLSVIEKEGNKFELVLEEVKPSGRAAQLAWRIQAKQKLKFAFSKPHLDSSLADLHKFTKAFTKLCSQIQKLDTPTSHKAFDRSTGKPSKRVKDCQYIQTASRELYNALCEACSAHANHSAHFKLEPRRVDFEERDAPLTRFNIVFTQPPPPGEFSSLNLATPVWLAIDSVLTMSEESLFRTPSSSGTVLPLPSAPAALQPLRASSPNSFSAIHTLGESLKRACDSPATITHKKRKSRNKVSFATSIIQTFDQEQTSTMTDLALPDFCLKRNFCTCVEQYSQNTLEDPERHIGYLQKTGSCKHLVYFATPAISCRQPREPVSLAELIAKMSQQQRAGSTMPLERVRLAKQLASAVLQFHDTPLLQRSWRSKDVVFFGNTVNTLVQRQMLAAPHLNVLVQGTNSVATASTPSSTNINELLVPNIYLFRLAVLLLEIAYQKPFTILKDEARIADVAEGVLRDFHIARQLSDEVSAQLGSEYSDVVKRCLYCRFNAVSGDLNDVILQEAVYKEVVMKLEDIEIGIVTRARA